MFADVDPKSPKKKAPLVLGKVGKFNAQKFENIRVLFESVQIEVETVKDIDGWLKTHAAMILGLASATYQKENLQAIVEDKALIKLIVDALRESMEVLKSLDVTIVPKRNKKLQLFPNFLAGIHFQEITELGIR